MDGKSPSCTCSAEMAPSETKRAQRFSFLRHKKQFELYHTLHDIYIDIFHTVCIHRKLYEHNLRTKKEHSQQVPRNTNNICICIVETIAVYLVNTHVH